MSSLLDQARTRFARAEPSGRAAPLKVVPGRRPAARRMPFVALVVALLAAGLVGLLLVNTAMQRGSFTLSALQQRADALTLRQQSLQLRVDALRNPQRLARRAQALGMVPNPNPAFLKLPSGHVLGHPRVAKPGTQAQIRPLPPPSPPSPPATSRRQSHHPARQHADTQHDRSGSQSGPTSDRHGGGEHSGRQVSRGGHRQHGGQHQGGDR